MTIGKFGVRLDAGSGAGVAGYGAVGFELCLVYLATGGVHDMGNQERECINEQKAVPTVKMIY